MCIHVPLCSWAQPWVQWSMVSSQLTVVDLNPVVSLAPWLPPTSCRSLVCGHGLLEQRGPWGSGPGHHAHLKKRVYWDLEGGPGSLEGGPGRVDTHSPEAWRKLRSENKQESGFEAGMCLHWYLQTWPCWNAKALPPQKPSVFLQIWRPHFQGAYCLLVVVVCFVLKIHIWGMCVCVSCKYVLHAWCLWSP